MNRIPLAFAAVVCLFAAAAPSPGVLAQDGFEPLFDGRSLAGWHTIPLGKTPGQWFARDGLLTFDSGDNWLASDATFTDFVLRLEYRAGPTSDSGIFLRSAPTGYPSFTGMELEIKGGDAGAPPTPRSTGSVYGAVAPLKSANRPAGEWNAVEVSVIGRRLAAVWNGETIHDIDLDDPRYAGALRGPLSARVPSGHVGMQAHLDGEPVAFRNVRIRRVEAGTR